MASDELILYTIFRSSAAWRVRIALHLKGLSFESKTVKWDDEKVMADIREKNPSVRIPVLVHNGKVLTESLAIVEYIDEVFPGPKLLPADPFLRHQARAIALHVTAGIQPLQIGRTQNKLEDMAGEGKGAEWAAYWLHRGLAELEEMVAKTAGKYCVGDDVTIADVVIPSILNNARRWNADISKFPTLLKIDKNLAEIPAFIAAHALNQPDAPASKQPF
ncbi:hypothetical protein PRIPAC_81219 [Pristionchus pacificus]|uniref:maleylacetoacetate isomerase n=1 Tax=Pristionchus pacificus TaxID=54126 RepID=A0A454XV49_PRIPA|nr:hypothetical protein PRIPAC_81219 [Pristionchus pacificus]|eukprot:PDM72562.1 Glutathione S-transferase [Pristionchus pacificus]